MGKIWEKFRGLLQEEQLRKLFQKENLIVIILSGVLLLIIALPVKNKEAATDEPSFSLAETAGSGTGAESAVGQHTGTGSGTALAEYEEALEKRLVQLLEGIKGVGEVRVMVTLASSDEQVVEKDRPVKRTNTTESDSAGGNRTIYDVETGETTVYYSDGSASEPYVVKTLTPKVEGVAVVAEGAGTGEINKNITEAVQALFDLEAHKIKVIPGK